MTILAKFKSYLARRGIKDVPDDVAAAALGQARYGGGVKPGNWLDVAVARAWRPRKGKAKCGGPGSGKPGPCPLDDVTVDPEVTNKEAAQQKINDYRQHLSPDILAESGLRRAEIYDNPEDAEARIESFFKERGINEDSQGARGVYDRESGTLISSLWSSEDLEENGRNFYHELSHSLESKIQSDDWEAAWHEFADKGQDEGFAEAFSEYHVQKRKGDVSDFEAAYPATYAVFQKWGWADNKAKRKTLFVAKGGPGSGIRGHRTDAAADPASAPTEINKGATDAAPAPPAPTADVTEAQKLTAEKLRLHKATTDVTILPGDRKKAAAELQKLGGLNTEEQKMADLCKSAADAEIESLVKSWKADA